MKLAFQAQDKHVMMNGMWFHYRAWGSVSAPPLLILHGLTGHACKFDGVASALADQDHVLAVNQRGHGASSWGEEDSPTVKAEARRRVECGEFFGHIAYASLIARKQA